MREVANAHKMNQYAINLTIPEMVPLNFTISHKLDLTEAALFSTHENAPRNFTSCEIKTLVFMAIVKVYN